MKSLYEEHAREKAGAAEDWHLYSMRCMPLGGPVTHYIELKGAVYPLITRGKLKGQPNYRKRVQGTILEVTVTPEEHRQWREQWEQRNGKCVECQGEGKTVASVSIHTGATYRDCHKCKGTGKPTA